MARNSSIEEKEALQEKEWLEQGRKQDKKELGS